MQEKVGFFYPIFLDNLFVSVTMSLHLNFFQFITYRIQCDFQGHI